MPDTSQLVWLFFRFTGRVSRAAYFLAGLLMAVVQAFFLYRSTLVEQQSTAGELWASLFWVAVALSIWSNVALGVKRLHDLGRPGILSVTLFVPIVSLIAFVALCLMPGQPGPNQYGRQTNAPG